MPDDVVPVLARATVNLPDGFKVGTVRWVNANSEYIRDAIAASLLVVISEDD